MLELKYIKGNKNTLTHTEVYSSGVYIGYFLSNKSKFSGKYENWNFVSKIDSLKSFHAATKNKLLDELSVFVSKNSLT